MRFVLPGLAQGLDDNPAIKLRVMCQIDGTMTALAQFIQYFETTNFLSGHN